VHTTFGRATLATLLAAAPAGAAIPTSYPTGSGPANVKVGSDGRLDYVYQSNGDTIPDFSSAGYKGGSVPVPAVPVVGTLSPTSGDQTGRIQAAIDAVAARAMGADGFRGALLLRAGLWDIRGNVFIRASGVVLRGEGSGASGTILRRTAGSGDIINVTNDGGTHSEVPNTRHNMTASYVPVGATWFALDSAGGLSVGDRVMIVRPSTQGWIDDIGMGADAEWTPGSKNLTFDRTITEIDGNRVRIDAPLTIAFESRYGGGSVYEYTYSSRLQNVGIESLRAESTAAPLDTYGNGNGAFLVFTGVIDCWARDLQAHKIHGHQLQVTRGKGCTFRDITSYHDPVGAHSGPSIQMFTFGSSQQLLFYNISASDGGFEFTSASLNPGPNVYLESRVPSGFAASGPHTALAVATLYDRLTLDHSLSIQKWTSSGHGWRGYNQLVWNTHTNGAYNCERPQIAHQWVIGSTGARNPPRTGETRAECEYISHGTNVQPGSLYRAQLTERVGAAAVAAVLDGVVSPAPTPTPPSATPTPAPTATATPTATPTPAGDETEITPASSAVTASANDGNVPGNTVDDNLATRWSANGDGQWIRYDLGAVRAVSRAAIAFYSGNARRSSFDLQVSIDGANWSNVLTGAQSSGTTTLEESFEVGGASARYVRYLGHGNSSNRWNSLAEVSLFASAAATATPTPTPTFTPRPANPTRYEAETLAVAASSGDSLTTIDEAGFSAGSASMADTNAVGDYVRYRLPDVPSGIYNLRAGIKRWTTRAIVQPYVGAVGAPLGSHGSPVDLYGSTTSYVELDLGTWTIPSTGDKNVELRVTGRNAASAGYTICVDYLQLTPQ
jgi:hypothetical protein